jgi:hypothetical protein
MNEATGTGVDTAGKPPPPPPNVPPGKLAGWKYTNFRAGQAGGFTVNTNGTGASLVAGLGSRPAWEGTSALLCFEVGWGPPDYGASLSVVPRGGGTPVPFTQRTEVGLVDGADFYPDWSRGSQEIVFHRTTGSYVTPSGRMETIICAKAYPDGTARQLTSGHVDREPAVSADGSVVVFNRSDFEPDGDPRGLCVVSAAGGAVTQVNATTRISGSNPDWVRVGNQDWLAYVGYDGALWRLQVTPDGHAVGDPLPVTAAGMPGKQNPSWSPDGTYIAYYFTTYKANVPYFHTCLVEVATGKVTEVSDLADPDWAPVVF